MNTLLDTGFPPFFHASSFSLDQGFLPFSTVCHLFFFTPFFPFLFSRSVLLPFTIRFDRNRSTSVFNDRSYTRPRVPFSLCPSLSPSKVSFRDFRGSLGARGRLDEQMPNDITVGSLSSKRSYAQARPVARCSVTCLKLIGRVHHFHLPFHLSLFRRLFVPH